MNRRIVIIASIFFVLLCIPLLLNYLINRPACFEVVGEGADWLSFWGAYIGGIITALIGVTTLYYTHNYQNKQIKHELHREELRLLENTVAQSIAIFDASKLNYFALYFKDSESVDYTNVIRELEAYYGKVLSDANAFMLIYDSSTTISAQQKFIDNYKKCVEYTVNIVSELETQLSLISGLSVGAPEFDEALGNLVQISKKHKEYKEKYIQPAYDSAKEWLNYEREKLRTEQDSL